MSGLDPRAHQKKAHFFLNHTPNDPLFSTKSYTECPSCFHSLVGTYQSLWYSSAPPPHRAHSYNIIGMLHLSRNVLMPLFWVANEYCTRNRHKCNVHVRICFLYGLTIDYISHRFQLSNVSFSIYLKIHLLEKLEKEEKLWLGKWLSQ